MKLTTKHYLIILLALITSGLHFAAALDKQLFPEGPDPLFILNGLGYLGMIAAYFAPIAFVQEKHKLARWAFMGYTTLTILAWVVIWVGFYVIRDGHSFFDHDSVYGIPAKIVELILLYLLWNDRA